MTATHRLHRLGGAWVVAAAAAILAGCATSSAGAPAPSSTATLPDPSGPTVDVEMQDYAFAPATVEIEVGTAVRWTNRGHAPHTATAGAGGFETGQLTEGVTASQTFSAPGTYAYVCALHPDMRGSIIVVAATDAQSAPSSNRAAAWTRTTPDS